MRFLCFTVVVGTSKEELYQNFLSLNGLRNTRTRRMIVYYFLQHGHHVSSDLLYRSLLERGLSVGQATVYRTMRLLSRSGLARELVSDSGTSYFEPAVNECHHDHMVCTKCNRHIEFYNQELEMLQLQIAQQHNFQLTEHSHYFYGFCSSCHQ